MARQCALCGKGKNLAIKLIKLRGKYNPTKKKVQAANLQKLRLFDGRRVLACTSCIRRRTKSGLVA